MAILEQRVLTCRLIPIYYALLDEALANDLDVFARSVEPAAVALLTFGWDGSLLSKPLPKLLFVVALKLATVFVAAVVPVALVEPSAGASAPT
mmetsp:Transcript_21434/g.49268  ORF Transcript_21434/g.49268 Transcript_21434/m.49268 type:complete len:93 (+) Transcript_21434:408-686(+)